MGLILSDWCMKFWSSRTILHLLFPVWYADLQLLVEAHVCPRCIQQLSWWELSALLEGSWTSHTAIQIIRKDGLNMT